ncbi:MAG: lipopolysaccharide heptosyltransferase II [Myxococcota bacterium]
MPDTKQKITVILPNHLGDVVMATPALRSLRAGFPDAEIRGVVRRGLGGILGGTPWLDQLIEHDLHSESGAWGKLRHRLKLGRSLRDTTLCIVLPNSFSSALLAAMTGARRRLGYRRGARGWLLTDRLEPPRENGRVVPIAMERYYLDLVVRLGCPDAGTRVELHREPEADKRVDELFGALGVRADRPLVCIAPGAGFGPSKLWPLEYYAEAARALLDEENQVALVHAPGEEKLADEILRRAGPGVLSLGGARLTLPLLKSVIARASLLLCNDAGARHVSAAFAVPTLVMMGPTSIRYTNLNLSRTRVLREPVECAPCQRKVCPIDHRCMTRLRPERVVTEAREALLDPDWRGDVGLELRQ